MKIAFVSAELAPYVQVGGLADVARWLPTALVELGHDVRVFTPHYDVLDPGEDRVLPARVDPIDLGPPGEVTGRPTGEARSGGPAAGPGQNGSTSTGWGLGGFRVVRTISSLAAFAGSRPTGRVVPRSAS